MNKPSLISAIFTALNSTSILRTAAENPSDTNVHGTPTNVTLNTAAVSNCTQVCALGGLACVVALPNNTDFCWDSFSGCTQRC
ncbi:hypothetical protein BDV28DRAFT_149929 [Aspergillus coremiiformis]|uniref:Uncharacterized protein n=1 Tax=Aspergillus coremiiformis TaxID=138285 RepID=A0A5N6Z1J9_9EURO|nr:hypothetical protein BDV28DRAFT_149929 [Aspergillus coremiiformis]